MKKIVAVIIAVILIISVIYCEMAGPFINKLIGYDMTGIQYVLESIEAEPEHDYTPKEYQRAVSRELKKLSQYVNSMNAIAETFPGYGKYALEEYEEFLVNAYEPSDLEATLDVIVGLQQMWPELKEVTFPYDYLRDKEGIGQKLTDIRELLKDVN